MTRVFLILLAASLVPVVVFPLGLSGDYPNYLVAYAVAAEGALHPYFTPDWQLNLHAGMAAVYPLMAAGAPPEWAGMVYQLLALSVLMLGLLCLHRSAFERTSPSLLLALPAVYGFMTYYGFLDFVMGIGLSFLVLGLSRFPARPGASVPGGVARCLLLAALAALAVLTHLLAFLFLGLMLLIERLLAARRQGTAGAALRHIAAPAVWLLPSFALIAFKFLSAPEIPFAPFTPDPVVGPIVKIIRMTSTAWAFGADLVVGSMLAFLFVLGMLFAAWREGFARFAAPLALNALAVLALGILLPGHLKGVVLDGRFGFVATLLLIAAVGPGPRAALLSEGKRRLVTAALALPLVLQVAMATPRLAATERLHAEVRAAFVQLPERATLIASYGEESAFFQHSAAFHVLDRQGFYPSMLLQVLPIEVRPAFAAINGSGIEIPDWRLEEGVGKPLVAPEPGRLGNRYFYYGWPERFDYLIHLSRTGEGLPYDFLTPVVAGERFVLYRITGRDR